MTNNSLTIEQAQAKIKRRRIISVTVRYIVLIVVGIIMLYPLIWMVGATFKTNAEIFTTLNPIPKNPTLQGYKDAMESYGGNINISNFAV